MQKLFSFLNLVLIAVTVYIANFVIAMKPEQRYKPYLDNPMKKNIVDNQPIDVEPRIGLTPRELEVISERNLFRPDRKEGEIVEPTTPTTPTAPQINYKFELTAVCIVGDKKVALINAMVNGGIYYSKRRIYDPRTRRYTYASSSKPKPKQGTKVYRIGDAIADSGYKITTIEIAQVTLNKENQEDIILKLESTDQASIARTQNAARAAAVRPSSSLITRRGARATSTNTVHTPPPPPPPPRVSLPTPSYRNMSREERLRRSKEMQERLLKLRGRSR